MNERKDRIRKYPTTIEVDDLKQWDHISDAEIAKDIADTERESEGYRQTQAAERIIADSHPNENERHLADFRASGREGQIRAREEFVAFLRLVQKAREERAGVPA